MRCVALRLCSRFNACSFGSNLEAQVEQLRGKIKKAAQHFLAKASARCLKLDECWKKARTCCRKQSRNCQVREKSINLKTLEDVAVITRLMPLWLIGCKMSLASNGRNSATCQIALDLWDVLWGAYAQYQHLSLGAWSCSETWTPRTRTYLMIFDGCLYLPFAFYVFLKITFHLLVALFLLLLLKEGRLRIPRGR